VQNGNTAKIQNVTVALAADNNTGISSGLDPGDVVVTDGQDKLQDGSKVNPSTSPNGSNAQNANGAQQPSAEPGNTQTGSGSGRRGGRGSAGQNPQAPQQGHSGKSQ
jgi:membrane fusion protein, multidrug efflux system